MEIAKPDLVGLETKNKETRSNNRTYFVAFGCLFIPFFSLQKIVFGKPSDADYYIWSN